jgi:type II secretory pathway pseudopilin PulG
MQKKIIWTAAALAMIALASTWGFPGVSRGEDFLEKLKKAAEQAAQQRQKQRQQQQQQQAGQQRQPQTSQQPQGQQPAQPQPRYKPGGGTKLLPNVKPQPSPDFGTPEGTAKIAAKAGFLEVVGIKLGMPVKDAVEALKSHNGGFKSGPITLREYEALPGVVMTPVLYAPNPAGPNATSGDDFNLLITYPPNEAFVWGIVRNMGFGTNATRPTLENTLAGLRQKYGPESTRQVNSRLIWIYDANGQQVMGQQAMDIYNQCSQTWMVGQGGSIGGNNPDRNNQFSNSFFDQQLKGGYYYGTGGMGSPGGVCHTHSLVDVYYTHAIPAGSAADLVISMTMGVYNRQLEASGVTASHTHLMAGVDKLNDKRAEEEGKRGGMKF